MDIWEGEVLPQIFPPFQFFLEKCESGNGSLKLFLGVVHIDSDSLGSYSRKPKSGGNCVGKN